MSTPQPEATPAQRLRSLRILAAALAVWPFLLLLRVWVETPPHRADGPTTTSLAIVVASTAAAVVAAEVFGFRVKPLETADHEHATEIALKRHGSAWFIRLALTDTPLFVGVVLLFALDEGPWPMILAILFGVPAQMYEIWPNGRNIGRIERRLDSRGIRSRLSAAFDLVR